MNFDDFVDVRKIGTFLFSEVAVQKFRVLNPLSANPTKWSNILKQFVGKLPTNCLSVFDHFLKLALKGLRVVICTIMFTGKYINICDELCP